MHWILAAAFKSAIGYGGQYLVHKTRTPTPARLANEDAACFELDADLLYQA
ncbi:MAG: hypothetical protein ACLUVV_04370 [Christensenellales bacterium]